MMASRFVDWRTSGVRDTPDGPIYYSRQVAFFMPADGRGKWHAAWRVSGAAMCGNAAALGDTADRVDVFAPDPHPILCRHCYRMARSSTGAVS